jgi:predicted secreted protein
MKKYLALLTLAVAALMAVPTFTRAEDSATATAPDAAAPAHKKAHSTLPFHGKLAAIDTTAMTVTVGKQTYSITSETKISKDDKPATLADFAVGDMVGGGYKKDGDKMNATSLKSGGKKKKAE